MTFPRHKSRGITVRGEPYRWVVGRVDREFVQRVHVEHATSPGQRLLCVFRDRFSADGGPVPPGRVRRLIEQALARGWHPTQRGPEFVLDTCSARPARFQLDPRAAAETDLSLESWTDLDPVRSGFPWNHYQHTFARFRVWGGASEIQIGTLVADVAGDRGATPGSDRATALRCLLPQGDESADDLTYYLPGGRILRRGDAVLMYHGCCTSLDEWVGWRELLSTGQGPWNGHDPMSTAIREGDRVRLVEAEADVTLDVAEYRRLVDALEQDLRDFLDRVQAWVRRHAPGALSEPIVAAFARTLKLPAPPMP